MDASQEKLEKNHTILSKEYVSQDILEENFVRCFSVFHIIQELLGTCRVRIRHRFVSEPTVYQKFYTCICTLITAFSNVVFIKSLFMDSFSPTSLVYKVGVIGMIVQFSQYFINTIHIRFFNTEANIQFYLKLQELDKKLKISDNNLLYDVSYNRHFVQVIFNTSGLIMALIKYDNKWSLNDLPRCLSIIASMSFYWEIMFFYNIVSFIKVRLRYINELLKIQFELHTNSKAEVVEAGILERNFQLNSIRLKDFIIKKIPLEEISSIDTVQCVESVLDMYQFVQQLYRMQVNQLILMFI